MMRDISALGAAPAVVGLAVVLWLLGFADLAVTIVAGLVLGFVIVVPIRLLYFKDRPRKKKFSTWWQRVDASSFPSLHAFRSVFLAVVLTRFDATFLFVAVFYAIIICYSRIHLEKHDWVDVAAGAVLGATIGLLL